VKVINIAIGASIIGVGIGLAARAARSGSANRVDNADKIQKMLDNMPKKWARELDAARAEQRALGLDVTPDRPSVDDVVETVLEITAGERKAGTSQWAGERGAEDVEVPSDVAEEAMYGLELAYRHDYPAWKFIGLARAMQLATRRKIWRRSRRRIRAYFSRHQKDKLAPGFGDDQNPSKGYLAHLVWGGTSAESWA
jgi:hypothetical protein